MTTTILFNILGYLMLLHVKANKNDKAKAVMLTNVLATSQLDPDTPGPFIRREAKECWYDNQSWV